MDTFIERHIGEHSGYYIKMLKSGSHHCDFFVTKWASCNYLGQTRIEYFSEVDTMYPISQDSPKYISGSIKWDGCINYIYDEQKECMLHQCGLDDFKEIYQIFKNVYDMASELMPENSKNLASKES